MVSLERYRVPTEPFRKMLAHYLVETGIVFEDFSAKCGLDDSTIRKALSRDEIRFDLADKIMCESYGPLLWHRPPFEELYWQGKIPPDPEKPVPCKSPECGGWFSLPTSTDPGIRVTGQQYCSRQCQQNHRNRLAGMQRKGYETHCRRGHLYAEHGRVDSRGRKICKICRAESKKKYDQRPEVRERKAAYLRRYRAEKAA